MPRWEALGHNELQRVLREFMMRLLSGRRAQTLASHRVCGLPWVTGYCELTRSSDSSRDGRSADSFRFSEITLRYVRFDAGGYTTRMSRLRRLVVSDHWFFITCRLLPRRRILSESEFDCLAQVIHERRAEHGFLLTAWVLMPDHWHAIFYPPHPLTISTVMECIKVGATKRINRARRECGLLWQPRFFDRALRTVQEYGEKVRIHPFEPGESGAGGTPRTLALVERARLRGYREPGPDDPDRIAGGPRLASH